MNFMQAWSSAGRVGSSLDRPQDEADAVRNPATRLIFMVATPTVCGQYREDGPGLIFALPTTSPG
jgi:hypothetical protein